MALDRVQPVPWVLGLGTRLPSNQRRLPPAYSRSLASWTLWPPLSSTAQPYCSPIRRAACSMAGRPSISIPARRAASGMLGVATRAMGSRTRRRVSTASGWISRAPLVATITGSSTMFRAP